MRFKKKEDIMQRVLVTGGTGFLGSSIVQRLVSTQGIEYVVVPTTNIRGKTSLDLLKINSKKLHLINGDVRDYDFIQRMFNEYEFDVILHLGAQSEVRKCQGNAKLAYDTNIGGTINLLEAARLFGNIKAIVVSSSDKAYGNSELPYVEGAPLDGKGIYEVSKSCQDLIARSYFYNYNLPVVVTRCSNLYGGTDMNFSRIIPNTIRSIFNNKSPLIWTGAENFIREFLYVEDAVSAYLSLAKNIEITMGNAYNIGSGEKITIRELVTNILDKISTNVEIEYREKTFPEISNQYLDSSKIKKDIGWESEVNLDKGLDNTIEAYRQRFLKGEI
jgi:CDP-glucose 4,6-dehydratase